MRATNNNSSEYPYSMNYLKATQGDCFLSKAPKELTRRSLSNWLLSWETPLQQTLNQGANYLSSWVPHFIKNVASYCADSAYSCLVDLAEDWPVQNSLPLPWEINYGDPAYWDAHMTDVEQELFAMCDALQTHSNLDYEPILQKVANVQAIVGFSLVSPYRYTKLLNSVQRKLSASSVEMPIEILIEPQRKQLKARLHNDLKTATQCFEKDCQLELLHWQTNFTVRPKRLIAIAKQYGDWLPLASYHSYLVQLCSVIEKKLETFGIFDKDKADFMEKLKQQLNKCYHNARSNQPTDSTEFDMSQANKSAQSTTFFENASLVLDKLRLPFVVSLLGGMSAIHLAEQTNWFNQRWDDSAQETDHGLQQGLLAATNQIVSFTAPVIISYQLCGSSATCLVPLWLSSQCTSGAESQGNLAPPGPRGNEFQINTQVIGHHDNVDSVALKDGGFVVTWSSDYIKTGGSIGIDVRVRLYTMGGTPKGSEFTVNSVNGMYSNSRVASFHWGGFIITWHGGSSEVFNLEKPELSDIFAAVYDNFGNPLVETWRVNEQTLGMQLAPSIAVLSDDSFVISWIDHYYDDEEKSWLPGIYARSFDLGAAFELVYLTDSYPITNNPYVVSYFPSHNLISLLNGGFAAVWEESIGGSLSWNLKSSCYDYNFQQSSVETVVNEEPILNYLSNVTDKGSQTHFPSLSLLKGGDFVVGWMHSPVGKSNAYMRKLDDKCKPIDPSFIVDEILLNSSTPVLVTMNDFKFVVFWRSWSDKLYFKVFNSDLSKVLVINSPVNLSPINSATTMTICALTDNGFVVFWGNHEEDSSRTEILGRRYNSQYMPVFVERVIESQVNSNIRGNQNNPVLAPLKDGGFVVAWDDDNQKNGYSDIYAQLYYGNGEIKRIQYSLNFNLYVHRTEPKLLALSSGYFSVFWYEIDSQSESIKGRIYDRNGDYATNVFTVKTGDFFYYNVTAFQDGFLVVWENESSLYFSAYDGYGNKVVDTLVIIESQDGIVFLHPSVASLKNDKFVVCFYFGYEDHHDGGYGFYIYDNNFEKLEFDILGLELENDHVFFRDVEAPSVTTTNKNGNIIFYYDAGYYKQRRNETVRHVSSYIEIYNSVTYSSLSLTQLASTSLHTPLLFEFHSKVFSLEDNSVVALSLLVDEIGPRVVLRWLDDSGKPILNMSPVSQFPTGRQNSPDGVALLDGGFLVAWASRGQDDFSEIEEYGIFIRRFNSFGDDILIVSTLKDSLVNTKTFGNQKLPYITDLVRENEFLIFWQGLALEGSSDIYASKYDYFGKKISFNSQGEKEIALKLEGFQGNPKAIVLDNDDLVVCWVGDYIDADTEIFIQKYDKNLNPRGDIRIVNTLQTGFQARQEIVRFSDESFVVVWESLSKELTNDKDILAQYFDKYTNKINEEIVVISSIEKIELAPKLAVLEGDNVVVTCMSLSNDLLKSNVNAIVLDSRGNFVTGKMNIENDSVAETERSFNYFVSCLSNGGFAITWTNSNLSSLTYSVKLQVFDNKYERVGDIIKVAETNFQVGKAPYILSMSLGLQNFIEKESFLVFWAQSVPVARDDKRYDTVQVFGQHFDYLGKSINLPQLISTNNIDLMDMEISFSCSLIKNNNFVLSWQAVGSDDLSDPTKFGIYAKIYSRDLEPIVQLLYSSEHGLEKRISKNGNFGSIRPYVSSSYGCIVLSWINKQIDGKTSVNWVKYDLAGNFFANSTDYISNSYQENLKITLFLEDNLLLIWEERDDYFLSTTSIHARVVKKNGCYLDKVLLFESEATQRNVDIFLREKEGDFIAVWEYSNVSREEIRVQSFSFFLEPLTQYKILESSAGYHRNPKITPWEEKGFRVWWNRNSNEKYDHLYDIVYVPLYFHEETLFDPAYSFHGSSIVYFKSSLDDYNFSAKYLVSHNITAIAFQNDGGDMWYNGIMGDLVVDKDFFAETLYQEKVVNTQIMKEQQNPDIAILREKQIIYVWQDNSIPAFGWELYLQAYNFQFERIDQQILINTYRNGDQIFPKISALLDGGFIVVWQSEGLNEQPQIYAQRFNRLLKKVSWEQLFSVANEVRSLTYIEDEPSWFPSVSLYSPYGDLTVDLIFSIPEVGQLQINTSSINFTQVIEGHWRMMGYYNDVNIAWSTLQFLPQNNENRAFEVLLRAKDLSNSPENWQVAVKGVQVNDAPFILQSRLPREFTKTDKLIIVDLANAFYDVDDPLEDLNYALGPCFENKRDDIISNLINNSTSDNSLGCHEKSVALMRLLELNSSIPFELCGWVHLEGSQLVAKPSNIGDWCIALQVTDPHGANTVAGFSLQADEPDKFPDNTEETVGIVIGTLSLTLLALFAGYKGREHYREDTEQTRAFKNQLIQEYAYKMLIGIRKNYWSLAVESIRSQWGEQFLYRDLGEDNYQPTIYVSVADDRPDDLVWVTLFLKPSLTILGFKVYTQEAKITSEITTLRGRHAQELMQEPHATGRTMDDTTYVIVVGSANYIEWYESREGASDKRLIEDLLDQTRCESASKNRASAVIIISRTLPEAQRNLPEIMQQLQVIETAGKEDASLMFDLAGQLYSGNVRSDSDNHLNREIFELIKQAKENFERAAREINRRSRKTIEREMRNEPKPAAFNLSRLFSNNRTRSKWIGETGQELSSMGDAVNNVV